MTNPQAQTQTPGSDLVTQREFQNALDGMRREFSSTVDYEQRLASLAVEKERDMRLLTERLQNEALKNAADFITEKSKEHNNLIQAGERKEGTFATKESVEKIERVIPTFVTNDDLDKMKQATRETVRYYCGIVAIVVLVLNFALRYLFPGK